MFSRTQVWSPSSTECTVNGTTYPEGMSIPSSDPCQNWWVLRNHNALLYICVGHAGWHCLIGIQGQHQIIYNIVQLIRRNKISQYSEVKYTGYAYCKNFVCLTFGWALVQAILMVHLALSLHFFSTCTANGSITCAVSVLGEELFSCVWEKE